ncbi:MAG: hypothetical protein A4E59_01462 [Syntrophorhabdus sp. PtaB.Bin027]|nr:MAG: hypothetical protein A4E59_01462 [Syntrophorhabdus sp. PtaB.Bin027]
MNVGIIDTDNIEPIERYLVEKGEKCCFYLVYVLIKIEVFEVNVGSHRDGWEKKKKCAVTLIGFCNEKLAASQFGITPQAV